MLLQFGEYLKRSRHDSQKSAKKYIHAFDSFFGLQVVSKKRIFLDRLVGRLHIEINKAKETHPDCTSDFEKIEHAIDREDIQTIMLGMSAYKDQDGKIRKRDLFNTINTIVEGGVSQRCFDIVFKNVFDIKNAKTRNLPGRPFIIEQRNGNPLYFFGETSTVLMRREIFDYNTRYDSEITRRTRARAADYRMSTPGYPFYSYRLFAEMDLRFLTNLAGYVIHFDFIPTEHAAFVLLGEAHMPSYCIPSAPSSISVGKFLVDLANACPDVNFEFMIENAPLTDESDTPLQRSILFQDPRKCLDVYRTLYTNLRKGTLPNAFEFIGGVTLADVKQFIKNENFNNNVPDGFLTNSYRYFFPIYPEGRSYHNETLLSNVRLHSADIRHKDKENRVFTIGKDNDFLRSQRIRSINFHDRTYTHLATDGTEHTCDFPRIILKAIQKLEDNILLEQINSAFQKLHNEDTTAYATQITDYYGLLRSLRFINQNKTRSDVDGRRTVVIFYGGAAHARQYGEVLRGIFDKQGVLPPPDTGIGRITTVNVLTKLTRHQYFDYHMTDNDGILRDVFTSISRIVYDLHRICLEKYNSDVELNTAFTRIQELHEVRVLQTSQQLLEILKTLPEEEYTKDIDDPRNVLIYVLQKIKNTLLMMHLEASSSGYTELAERVYTYSTLVENHINQIIQNELGKPLSSRARSEE